MMRLSAMTEVLFGESLDFESVARGSSIDPDFVCAIEHIFFGTGGGRRTVSPGAEAELFSEIVDVSAPLDEATALWPSSAGVSVNRLSDIRRGDAVNASIVTMDVHAGTHVDAPLHFLAGGADASSIPLDSLVGPAHVVEVSERRITSTVLERHVPAGTERLLLRTANSTDGRRNIWHDDFAALTLDGAEWLVEQGMRMVANDYLSIQLYGDSDDTHRALLGGGVVIVEGMDLRNVLPGPYFLVCLPLRLAGAEAAPARAVLLRPAERSGTQRADRLFPV